MCLCGGDSASEGDRSGEGAGDTCALPVGLRAAEESRAEERTQQRSGGAQRIVRTVSCGCLARDYGSILMRAVRLRACCLLRVRQTFGHAARLRMRHHDATATDSEAGNSGNSGANEGEAVGSSHDCTGASPRHK